MFRLFYLYNDKKFTSVVFLFTFLTVTTVTLTKSKGDDFLFKKVTHYGEANGYHVEKWNDAETSTNIYTITRYEENTPSASVITGVKLCGAELIALSIYAMGVQHNNGADAPIFEGTFNRMPYKILRFFGTIRLMENGDLLFTETQFGNREPFYDLRVWSKDRKAFEKGVGMNEETFGKLLELILDVIDKEQLEVPRFNVNTIANDDKREEELLCDYLIATDKAYAVADAKKIAQIKDYLRIV